MDDTKIQSDTARPGQPERPEFSTFMAKYIFEGVVMALDGFWRLPESVILTHGEKEGRVIADTLVQAGIARWVEIDGRRDLAAPVPYTSERKELRKYARMMGARGGREAARKAKKMGFVYPEPPAEIENDQLSTFVIGTPRAPGFKIPEPPADL